MSRKKKKTEEKEINPLHKEFGLWSNMKYVLRNMFETVPMFKVYIPVGIICAPLMNYLWTFIAKFVVDMITEQGEPAELLKLCAIVTGLQIIATVLNSWRGSKWSWFIYVRTKMKVEFNRKAMTIDFKNTEDPQVLDCREKGEMAANDNNNGIEGMMRQTVGFMESLAVIAVGFAIMGSTNVWLAGLMILLSIACFMVRNKANKDCKEQVWDPLAPWWRKNNYLTDTTCNFEAAKDIRMFGLSDWLTEKFRKQKKIRYEAQRLNEKIWCRSAVFQNISFAVSQGTVYGWLIYKAAKGDMTIGSFSLYVASAQTFYAGIIQIMENIANLFQRSREVDDWRSFLTFDGGDPDEGKDVPCLDKYEFTFKNVSFKYPKAEKYALKNLSLTLKAGERLAVVGLNGAGKSTFIKLLLRLYEPTEGEILLNGVNIKEYSKNSYYRVFAPVFQDVNLFAFPLAENVSMKSPENTDRKLSENCLADAGLADKLISLPKGIDTEMLKIIYDDGTDLSGGEKQKLALARALYKNAPVVVLDEPTAALDALAESKLYSDFDKLIGGKTAVYISHRLSSTQFCSRVAMFRDGEMAELGTHRELMERDGEYAKMFRLQAQYYVDDPEEVTANAG